MLMSQTTETSHFENELSSHIKNQINTLIENYWHTGFFTNWWDQHPMIAEQLNVYTGHYIHFHANEFDFNVDNANDCELFDADTGYHINQQTLKELIE